MKPTLDVAQTAFDQLSKAAEDSTWVPPYYSVGDWVADCDQFLRTGSGPYEVWGFYQDRLPHFTWRDEAHPELGERLTPDRANFMVRKIEKLQRSKAILAISNMVLTGIALILFVITING